MDHTRITVVLLLMHISILGICQLALSSRLDALREMERKEADESGNKCIQLISETQGPYWVEENIHESNLRWNLSYGVPLNLTFRVIDGILSSQSNKCEPIALARIDLWHCRYDGHYSDEILEHSQGEKWLRGYQLTNSSGYASFTTIYPGWYKSRTVHIHVRVRLYNKDNSTSYEATTQIYFDDVISDTIFNNVYPYNARGLSIRDRYNTNDTLFVESNVVPLMGDYTNQHGYSGMVEFKVPLVSPIKGGEESPSLTK